MSGFDQFSGRYRELLDRNISISGEKSEYFAAYKARFIATRVAPKPDCRILDYGCGVGLVCGQLQERLPRARIDGYDVSRACLERIDAKLRVKGTYTDEARELGRDYDVVILANVMHHVGLEARFGTIAKAREYLGAKGRLVVFEHNPANPLTRRAVESCPFDEDAVLLPPRETVLYFQRLGFSGTRVDYIVFFPHFLGWLRPLEPFLRWCPLGAQYVVMGSKA